jgi:multidrug resistance protein
MKRSPLIILFVTIFIDLLGFGIVLPLLPIYIRHYGGTPAVGGWLLASFSVMQFLFSPIWGRLSDRHGRRPMILLSLVGSSISFFFFGAAPNLVVLFIARIAAGILSAASLPTAQAYIADTTTPEKRASGMAVLGAAFGLGFAFGPMLGGVLSQHPVLGISPLAMPAYFAALLSLANFVWAWFALPETHHDRSDTAAGEGLGKAFSAISAAISNPAVRREMLVYTFLTFSFTAVESAFSWLVLLRFDATIHERAVTLWEKAHSIPFASLPLPQQTDLLEKSAAALTTNIFIIVGLTTLVVYGLVMRGLARRVGEHRLVMAGALLLTGTLIGIAFAQTLTHIWILSALIAVGSGMMNPALSALITHAADPRERGSLARIIAPPVNNYFVGVNTAIPFVGSAVLMGVAFLLSLSLRPLPAAAPEE